MQHQPHGINLTASCRVSSCPNTDLIAEVAEAIFCLSCIRIIGVNDYKDHSEIGTWKWSNEVGVGGRERYNSGLYFSFR